jgi:hypothetical protein
MPREHFSNALHFSQIYINPFKSYPEPPSGAGQLEGRITYQGKPAAGIELKLLLDGKFKSRKLVTNERGVFQLKLANGKYRITSLITDKWNNKPAGKHVLLSGFEKGPAKGSYSVNHYVSSEGLQVEVNGKNQSRSLEFVIRDAVEVLWPKQEGLPEAASVKDKSIEWKPVKGATQYLVQVYNVKRSESSVSYFPLSSRLVKGENRLPIRNFKTVKHTGKKMPEYTISVYAFDMNSKLITYAEHGLDDYKFKLDESMKIVGDPSVDFYSSMNEETLKKVMLNQKRMDSIEFLIEEKMYLPAKALLGKYGKSFNEGVKVSLSGYLAAHQGDCKKAAEMFEKVREGSRVGCIKSKYWAGCKAR